MGKTRLIAETGAGQHGVATATGRSPYGYGMCRIHGRGGHKTSGAQCIPHASARSRGYPGYIRYSHIKGCRIGGNERVDQENFRHTLLPGLVMGPHPFPTIVRDFQAVISKEIKEQMLEKDNRLPDAVIACVGGGSNAIGSFYNFIEDEGVELIGCEAAGRGIDTFETAATVNTCRLVFSMA